MKILRSPSSILFGAFTVLVSSLSSLQAAAPLPNSLVASNYFYTVSSNASAAIWVAPPTWKVMRDTPQPGARAQGIDLSAARNEFEPVQIVSRSSATGTRSLNLGPTWSGPSGSVLTATLHEVGYGPTTCAVGEPDRLNPIAFGSSSTVCTGNNQVFWLTVFVPTNAAAGIYSNTITCVLPGLTTNIPIRVHVFNFTLPAETSFGSFVNWGFSGSSADAFAVKRWFHEHRLTPTLATWPSAMSHFITWDSGANPSPCAGFYDEGDQPAQFSIRWLADAFVAGSGFNNGVGFPNFMAEQYVSSSQPRPATFCGQSVVGDPRGSDYGTAAYNTAWGNFLTGLQNYCDATVPVNNGGNPFGHDYLSKAVYWVMNEPQSTSEYNLAAWLASVSRQAAPRLRLLISKEARPEIYDNALYPGQSYDIWLAHLPNYGTAVGNSMIRRRDHREQTWWYALPTDPLNFINPNQTNRPAIETRILSWLAWNQRVEGWSDSGIDTSMTTFLGGTSFAPTIRSELLRESIEDYEYFKLANGGHKAAAFQPNPVDNFVSLIAGSLTGFDRDPTKLHWLRDQLGLQISGEAAASPLLPQTSPRAYGSYYLNFQGSSPVSPVTVSGHTWSPVGWQLFDSITNSLGWYVPDTNQLFTAYNSLSSSNELQKSYLYDDYGRQVTFVFALANGVYDLEVGMGRPNGNSQGLVTVNGVDVFGDRLANAVESVTNNVARTKRVAVTNNRLVMEVGQPSNGDYNLLDYLGITAVSPGSADDLDDLWQTQNFGSATNNLAAPGADPDSDGAVNFMEYHFGTDPNSAASRPMITATLPAPDQVQLQWTSASNHVFRIDQSSDLINWSVALEQVPAKNATTAATIGRVATTPQGFYRIVPIAP